MSLAQVTIQLTNFLILNISWYKGVTRNYSQSTCNFIINPCACVKRQHVRNSMDWYNFRNTKKKNRCAVAEKVALERLLVVIATPTQT